jgi:hypothetical protein
LTKILTNELLLLSVNVDELADRFLALPKSKIDYVNRRLEFEKDLTTLEHASKVKELSTEIDKVWYAIHTEEAVIDVKKFLPDHHDALFHLLTCFEELMDDEEFFEKFRPANTFFQES